MTAASSLPDAELRTFALAVDVRGQAFDELQFSGRLQAQASRCDLQLAAFGHVADPATWPRRGRTLAVPQALSMCDRGFNGMRARLLQPELGWLQLRLLRGWDEPSGWRSEQLLTLHWDGSLTLIEEMCAR